MIKRRENKYRLDHSIRAKSDDHIGQLHEYDVDIKSNHIFLMGTDRGYELPGQQDEPGVDFYMANRFIRNINLCMRANREKPIVIHMKTCGGYWEEGMAIYDAIKSCPSKVTILNYTHARSMSSIIFQAADKKVMMPHSTFMYHDGTWAMYGTVKQVKSEIRFGLKQTDIMLGIYASEMQQKGKFKNKSISLIKGYLKGEMSKKEDVFLTSHQAVELGLADEVFNYDWKSLTDYQ